MMEGKERLKGKLRGIVTVAAIFAAGYLSNTAFTSVQRLEERLARHASAAEMDRFAMDYVSNRKDADYRMQVIKKAYAGLQGPEQDKMVKYGFQLIPGDQAWRMANLEGSLTGHLTPGQYGEVVYASLRLGKNDDKLVEGKKVPFNYLLKAGIKANEFFLDAQEDMAWYAKHVMKQLRKDK